VKAVEHNSTAFQRSDNRGRLPMRNDNILLSFESSFLFHTKFTK